MSRLRPELSGKVKLSFRNTYSYGTPIDTTFSVALAETVGPPRNENLETFV
jgi:hypothetical protein